MLPLTELTVMWGKLTINKQLDKINSHCDNCSVVKNC